MARTLASVLLVAAALAGCGGGTRTVTETVQARPPALSSAEQRQAYCVSPAGDAVAQAGSEAQAAYNAADLARMRRAVAKALRAARAAPAGAECAVNALNQIADLWNQGAGNLAGANIAAETAAIRRFQRAHKLTRTIF